ncbi:hypothetical protein C8Q78DRAFT_970457 [Trametes maxima]|nr:hypothetical protein C8Q78DRAFT_970457 [Trametes maxima]
MHPPPSPSPYGPPPPPFLRGSPSRARIASTSSAGYGAPSRARNEDPSPPRSRYGHGRDGSPALSLPSSSGERARRPSYVASGARWREEERDREERRYQDDNHHRDERGYVDRSKVQEIRRDEDYRAEREWRRDNTSRDRDRRSRSPSRTRHRSGSNLTRDPNDEQPTPPKKLTPEEIRTLWEDRVGLLSQAIEARCELHRLHEDLQSSEQLAKSSQYATVPEDDKAAVHDLIAATSSRLQQKQQELNRLVARLVPDDFWPFARREQYHGDPGFNRMTEVVADLKGKISLLFDALAAAKAAQPPAGTAADASVATTKAEPGEIIASVSAESTKPPEKRRRIASDEDGQVPDNSAAELDNILERLTALDYRLSELNNDILQYESKIEDEVEAQLDYRMAGLRLGVGGGGEKLADPDTQKKVERLAGDVTRVQAKVKASEDELAELQSQERDYDEKNARFQEQNEAMRRQIAELQASQAQMLDTVNAQTNEIRALSAAVTAYIARPLNPPLPPGPLTADTIIEAIRPKLIDAARDDLLPILEEVRAHIEKELQEQSTQVTTELRVQMAPLVRSVEWISAWVERIRVHSGSMTTTSTNATNTAPAITPVDKGKGIAR